MVMTNKEILTKAIEKAVENGAEVVIALEGVLNRLVFDAGVKQVRGAPVLPTLEIFVKFVEIIFISR